MKTENPMPETRNSEPETRNRQLTGLEYHYLIGRELKQFEGAWLDKVQQSGDGQSFRFKFRRGSIVARLPDYAYASEKPLKGLADSGFLQKMKKHVSGKKLVSVSQIGTDRLLGLGFVSGDGKETVRVIAELFQKGNMLIEENGKIIGVLNPDEFKDRVLKTGVQYLPPKSTGLALEFTAVELKKYLGSEPRYIISLLAKTHLGVTYARHILGRCNLEPKAQAGGLEWQDIEAIARENASLIKHMKPYALKAGGKIADWGLCKLDGNDGWRDAESLSEVIDDYENADRLNAGNCKPKAIAGEKAKKKLEYQLAHLRTLEQQQKEFADAGNAVYANYAELEKLLNEIGNLKNKGMNGEEINAALARDGKKAKISLKAGELEVELA
ncbi:hypothetical protein COT30_00045 [Candidatus Micrarchaeota archaeon CG08_land_8_20_14_0_20_49_17]|nr:MAG: hypothetical protein AUJ13_00180 [Candidatus Micrarchaeota archaeon CG1_02_49_24]PIU10292.1 MAG: hypothetical protein COT30_00045 [Candidatus Micrarchaeota archaeon CG08_land_8_20_14_0_20_49_17]PIU81759.1 MAG: hypothetical protein COS70_02520 [Candidatus Micrarchaeota archaeon CG06_land_8_20_14_3_00_50_6]PIZ97664.1 MAG: hypothetical protein COX84_02960 [Candidatus Micrarchaeota archaeon CG_4_10_14_0_2_um_filter_49_7]HII53336.1 hypothetical protein [Candidatus Micrarchaeota archaeon]